MEATQAYDVLDLKALRCFWATARHGSLTRAGLELGISEAAVSQRVKTLEAYLGTKLYESRGGRVKLTPAGQRTLEVAVTVFGELEEFRRTVRDQEVAGTVTLAAHDPVLRYLVPDVARRFKQAFPRARLRLLSRAPREVVELVRLNEADVGIVPERALPEGLAFHPWRTYEGYVIMPRDHPLAQRAPATFRDLLTDRVLQDYPLVVPETDDPEQQRVARGLRQKGLPYHVGLEVGTIETVKHYVARGLGIAVVSGICLGDEDRRDLDLLQIPPEFDGATTYGVVLHRRKHLAAPLKGLLPLLGVAAAAAPEPPAARSLPAGSRRGTKGDR
jgi:DNA-binding transcriptional LysR family regulator